METVSGYLQMIFRTDIPQMADNIHRAIFFACSCIRSKIVANLFSWHVNKQPGTNVETRLIDGIRNDPIYKAKYFEWIINVWRPAFHQCKWIFESKLLKIRRNCWRFGCLELLRIYCCIPEHAHFPRMIEIS